MCRKTAEGGGTQEGEDPPATIFRLEEEHLSYSTSVLQVGVSSAMLMLTGAEPRLIYLIVIPIYSAASASCWNFPALGFAHFTVCFCFSSFFCVFPTYLDLS